MRLPWEPATWVRAGWSAYMDRPMVEGAKNTRDPFATVVGVPSIDRSPCGALDMYGNVHEWVAGEENAHAVARGGSFLSRLPERAAPTRRYVTFKRQRGEYLGFRLAKDAGE